MSQTSYNFNPAPGLPGQVADLSDTEALSRVNGESSANLPFGIAVAQSGSSDEQCLLPAASTDLILGVTMRDHSTNAAGLASNGAIKPLSMASVCKDGTIFVLPEQTVVQTDPVYVRFSAGSGAQLQGRFRKDADGTAQVTTVTPTAVNSTVYNMSVNGRAYSYTSDSSATAAEIVTGFTTLINAETAQHGVTASGSTTLILTGTINAAFQTSMGANLTSAPTTPYASKAAFLPRARWASAGTTDNATGLILELV